ncbi:MAG: GNAT family N-acetyltransferase [Bacteroidota bacterium]
MIRGTLKSWNDKIFQPKGWKVALLKDHKEVIPHLAEWGYQTWRKYDKNLTKARLERGYTHRLHDDDAPLALVVFGPKNQPIGTVSLDLHPPKALADMDAPDKVRLGGLYVEQAWRNQGIGGHLLALIAQIAKKLNYTELGWYTSDLTKVSWYIKQGAEYLFDKNLYNSRKVAIMRMVL